MKHAHRKDNAYLLAENTRLRNALNGVMFVAKFGSKEYDIAREALAVQQDDPGGHSVRADLQERLQP